MSSSSDDARVPRLPPMGGIVLYSAALASIAIALFFVSLHGAEPLTDPHLPWWAIAVGWALAETCVVHLHFRRSAHSFSLADFPFVFGLAFASGDGFMAGALLGAGAAYAFRRLPPIKLAFNLAQLALAVCVAFVIVRAIAEPADTLEPSTWLALYVATLVTGALSIACIAGAIAIAEGDMTFATLRQMFAMDLVLTAANSSIAISAAVLISTDARAAVLLLVPAAVVFGLYRAYVSERQQHEKLEFLYESNRALTRSPEVAEAIEGVLARSLEAFRSEIAEVVLFSADGTPLRSTYGPGVERVTMVEADRGAAEALAAVIDAENPVVSLTPPYEPAALREHLQQRGIRNAMVAMLPGESRLIGVIMLANRFGLERGYGGEDRRLLEVLANNASVALQYDRLEQAVNKLRTLQEELHHQAYHDPLTGLPNRLMFMERLRGELADGTATLGVLFIDVDDFKIVNDTLGHAVGDALLVSVAGRLRHSVRPQDIVARLGGDEFAVMLPGVDDPIAELGAVATRVLRGFETPVHAADELVPVHLSVGIADSGRTRDPDELIREADLAMYQAKTSGKGRFAFFDPPMAAAMLRRHDLKTELAGAIERREIMVEYQPIVDLETGRISAGEALVRWEHPVRGRIGPAEFIPLAEESGLIRVIGRHVLEQTCRQARLWEAAAPDDPPLRLHVNLSAAELRDPDLTAGVQAMLEEFGLPPERLALEITETELLDDAVTSAARFGELRALGIRIALDDFGTGYSSLSYLHSLPLDTLKIAKPFVDGLVGEGRDASFIGVIVELARKLGLDVIAEGIETPAQLDALRDLGVEFGQGFLIGRPAAAGTGRFRRQMPAEFSVRQDARRA
ncbi:EAL domain-containing protein [Solirubrobacter ginsenosidimutans]|uniref:EAL domain-containing protein n=1 Tax=Solirubrobacter ginsenosidimutans TaxID=490573 RepID=A0A9X3S3A3_9ACTN|nr:GGDEF domain-containing protein [Solirubrobacter ginsenosidimutans]MDA0159268.1 EAL domain-containing protein [Solirubrobacter ginsenosidimutans]